MCGVAEFVQQEEFNRFTGYFWMPSATAYALVYAEVDETGGTVLCTRRTHVTHKYTQDTHN